MKETSAKETSVVEVSAFVLFRLFIRHIKSCIINKIVQKQMQKF